ncbi:MAG: hypothetical protein E6G68_04420, partial [Actinobacteria bacterium]
MAAFMPPYTDAFAHETVPGRHKCPYSARAKASRRPSIAMCSQWACTRGARWDRVPPRSRKRSARRSRLGRLKAKQVLLVGLGNRKEAKSGAARKAGAVVARKTGGAADVATTIPQAVTGAKAGAVEAFVEGYLLGAYRFDRYKANGQRSKTETVSLVSGGSNDTATRRAINRATVLADGTALARDLTNTPAGDFTPESFASEARRIAKTAPLTVRVLGE